MSDPQKPAESSLPQTKETSSTPGASSSTVSQAQVLQAQQEYEKVVGAMLAKRINLQSMCDEPTFRMMEQLIGDKSQDALFNELEKLAKP